MKEYRIKVTWTMEAFVQIQATSQADAIRQACVNPLPAGDYVDGSFEVDHETIKAFLCMNEREYKELMRTKGVPPAEVDAFLEAAYDQFGDDLKYDENFIVGHRKDIFTYNKETGKFAIQY